MRRRFPRLDSGGAPAPASAPPCSDPIAGAVDLVLPDPTAQELPALEAGQGPMPALRSGCYLINYHPVGSRLTTYDGTLRVEARGAGATFSGDLYVRRTILPADPSPRQRRAQASRPRAIPGPAPAAATGIPVFPRAQYRYYIRAARMLGGRAADGSVNLSFDLYRFDLAGEVWTREGRLAATMSQTAAPEGFPSAVDYLVGDLRDDNEGVAGRLTMGWVSPYLRSATIEIDHVARSEAPVDNGAAFGWKEVGDAIGWEIRVQVSDEDVSEPSGEFWSMAECHKKMLAIRESIDFDSEWRYHILCVRRLSSTQRGIMYDDASSDSNKIPREGCAVSTHWKIPRFHFWGRVRGERFGSAAMPYFRTAVHEIGHAMGLEHNAIDLGFMNTTEVISKRGTEAIPFPDNIEWTFAGSDRHHLRHLPDVYVRPGGVPLGTEYLRTSAGIPDRDFNPDGLQLHVTSLLDSVPLGAPARVDLRLTNLSSSTPYAAPADLGLGAGFVSGAVTDPEGVARSFAPMVLCSDRLPLRDLGPSASRTSSLTLLRGREGALFPVPGVHHVRVRIRWSVGEIKITVIGETKITVTPAIDEAHARIATRVLSTRDTLLALVLAGDHLEEGNAVIREALASPVLRPHFALIEARRLATRFGMRKADLRSAAELISQDTVMSSRELRKVAQRTVKTPPGEVRTSVTAVLRAKALGLALDDEVKQLVESL